MNERPPDLSSQEGRRSYRRELRRVAARSRRIGLLLLVAALMVGLTPIMDIHEIVGLSPRFLALLLLVPGALLLAFAVFAGTRHHRRRMRW